MRVRVPRSPSPSLASGSDVRRQNKKEELAVCMTRVDCLHERMNACMNALTGGMKAQRAALSLHERCMNGLTACMNATGGMKIGSR